MVGVALPPAGLTVDTLATGGRTVETPLPHSAILLRNMMKSFPWRLSKAVKQGGWCSSPAPHAARGHSSAETALQGLMSLLGAAAA